MAATSLLRCIASLDADFSDRQYFRIFSVRWRDPLTAPMTSAMLNDTKTWIKGPWADLF